MTANERILQRECKATLIPAGDKATLPLGTKVIITHRLGANFTITCGYGMFRISGKDADALDEEVPSELLQNTASDHKGSPSQESIWAQLKTVFDPEIPVNVVDLGLIYSMEIDALDAKTYKVNINMTLTAPGCGMGPAIAEDVKNRVLSVPGTHDVNVELVWDPPWTQDMISEAGKMELGLL